MGHPAAAAATIENPKTPISGNERQNAAAGFSAVNLDARLPVIQMNRVARCEQACDQLIPKIRFPPVSGNKKGRHSS
jgi:hypothetical protein